MVSTLGMLSGKAHGNTAMPGEDSGSIPDTSTERRRVL
jgi:hypothetical protein